MGGRRVESSITVVPATAGLTEDLINHAPDNVVQILVGAELQGWAKGRFKAGNYLGIDAFIARRLLQAFVQFRRDADCIAGIIVLFGHAPLNHEIGEKTKYVLAHQIGEMYVHQISESEEAMTQSVQFKMNLPAELKRWVSIEAARNMRSVSKEITFILSERMAAATGAGFADTTPVAALNPAGTANAGQFQTQHQEC